MQDECSHDHRFETYAARDRRLLSLVGDFNRRLVQAVDAGSDLAKVVERLDPDPDRYTWVDEGGGLVEAVLAEAEAELALAPRIAGHRRLESSLLAGAAPSARPALARRGDGGTLAAWIEWTDGAGERVVAQELDREERPVGEPRPVSGELADCLRPTVAVDGDGVGWIFFAKRVGSEVNVFASAFSPGGAQEPLLVSATPAPSFNQEVLSHADGSIECVWQGYCSGRFAIFSRSIVHGRLGDVVQLSLDNEANVWDPTIASGPDGEMAYAWTTYGSSGYVTSLLVRGRAGEERRRVLSVPAGYSLHPSLALAPNGDLLCAYDSVSLGGHGGSGPTRLRRREEMREPRRTGTRRDGRAVPSDLSPDVSAEVVVVRLHGPELTPTPTGRVGSGVQVSPAALPRLVTTTSGSVAVAYRALRRLPLMLYYWETVLEELHGGSWGGLTAFEGGDGPLEEPSIAAQGEDILLAWQSDGRRERQLSWTEGFGGEECLALRDHYGAVVWHSLHTGGTVRLARLCLQGREAAITPEPPPAARLVVETPEARPWAVATPRPARYSTTVEERSLALYWGDLHRHSLISRCTAGDEPELEDFYRYSFDVCEYDFWAVTDHAENTSPYQWWGIQKLADVLTVRGRFVPFYGFEWTSSTGHQNVIYESSARGAPIYSSTAAETTTPAQLWDHLRHAGQASLTIPHHPGSAMVPYEWSYGDEEMLRLVEIFQACRGNYENDGCFRQYADATLGGTFVQDGLRRGHRFGLIASSDHGNGASYVGAFAEELSREAVFAALRERRTIAATTRDIVVDFRLNRSFMGSVAEPADHATVEITARAYRDIARLDLVCNGAVVHTVEPEIRLCEGEIAVPLRVEWTAGETPLTDWSGHLEIEGGRVLETAYWSPEVVDVAPHRVAWSAETRNFNSQYGAQRGGVEMTLVGRPDAVVTVSTASMAGRTVLRSVESGPLLAESREGRLTLRAGTGGLRSLGTKEISLSVTQPVTRPDWFYPRVILEDGEMAWASPVWIEPAR